MRLQNAGVAGYAPYFNLSFCNEPRPPLSTSFNLRLSADVHFRKSLFYFLGEKYYVPESGMGNYTAISTLCKYYPIPRISVLLIELYTWHEGGRLFKLIQHSGSWWLHVCELRGEA